MTKIILSGIHGRMGKVLQELISKRDDCKVVAGIDNFSKSCDVPVFSSLNECDINADVIIDFSNASAVDSLVQTCCTKGIACVICTTGLDEKTIKNIKSASEKTAIFKSANMSLGINVLIALAKKANALFGIQYEVEIIEKHHHNKVDAPSGTAIMIGDAIIESSKNEYYYKYSRNEQREERNPLEIGMHAVRGGSIVGEHDVLFCGPDEVVTLSHSAASRNVFANGAISAALFLHGKKPGLYNMEDLINR